MMEQGYLLDTNICIYLFKGKYNIREKLREIGTSHCYISEITLAELIYGAQCSKNVAKHTKEIEDLMIENFDLLIGVTALANNLVMVTENIKHVSHIPGLSIENWVKK